MAGIGFELRKMLDKDSYFHDAKAYAYAALVTSGPWMLSILCFAVLGFYRHSGLTWFSQEVFRATIIYTYALSLIVTGLVQVVVTRYLADQLYCKRHHMTLRTLCTSAVLLLLTGAPAAVLFFSQLEASVLYRATAALTFVIVSLIWLAMIFLSAIKDYMSIVWAFFVGATCSVAGALALKGSLGLEGYLLGFALGQAVTFFWLLARLWVEYPDAPAWDRGLLRYFRTHWELVAVGVAYNLGIWADKLVFWMFAPDARAIAPHLVTHDLYEGPIFVAYITAAPTLAAFLLKLETRFFERYRGYYAALLEKRSYTRILQAKAAMVSALARGLREALILQGFVTLTCMLFSRELAMLARFSPLQLPILRIAFVGAFLQALLIIAIIVLCYFDLRRRVLVTALVFVTANAGFSWLSIQLGPAWYGHGYCFACLIALLVAAASLFDALDSLERLTFTGQPLTSE